MPESRDRRAKPLDVAAVFTSRRRSGIIDVLHDDVGSGLLGSTPSRVTAAVGATGMDLTRARGVVGGSFGTPIPSRTARQERNRPSQSLLPSWYPRTPLRDITAVVRAIERRRARLEESQGQQPSSPFSVDQFNPNSPMSVSGAPLEHGTSANSPNLAVGFKLRTPVGMKLPKILVDITNQSDGGSEFLTPQKKLLNSIDTIEKVMREEFQKLKRTPSAKKADREKRVRTLMSMR